MIIFKATLIKRLKYTIIILTLAAILLQVFGKAIILINFELNRDYIAANLCEKKEEVDNCCKGSCHLKKQLNEEDKKQPSSPSNLLKGLKELPLYWQKTKITTNFWLSCFKSSYVSFLITKLTNHSFSIFHPPQITA